MAEQRVQKNRFANINLDVLKEYEVSLTYPPSTPNSFGDNFGPLTKELPIELIEYEEQHGKLPLYDEHGRRYITSLQMASNPNLAVLYELTKSRWAQLWNRDMVVLDIPPQPTLMNTSALPQHR